MLAPLHFLSRNFSYFPSFLIHFARARCKLLAFPHYLVCCCWRRGEFLSLNFPLLAETETKRKHKASIRALHSATRYDARPLCILRERIKMYTKLNTLRLPPECYRMCRWVLSRLGAGHNIRITPTRTHTHTRTQTHSRAEMICSLSGCRPR